MAISEEWLPVINEGLSWIKEMIGPSKKELKIQVADLEKQVQMLTFGNAVLANNLGLITQAILNQLPSIGNFTINADTIVFIGENSGRVDVTKQNINGSMISGNAIAKNQVEHFEISRIFDGLDEEIAHSRAKKPSDRR